MREYWEKYHWQTVARKLSELSPSEMADVVWRWREQFSAGSIIERIVNRYGKKTGLTGVVVEIRQCETAHADEFSHRIVRWTDGTRESPNPVLFEDSRKVGTVEDITRYDLLKDFEHFDLP